MGFIGFILVIAGIVQGSWGLALVGAFCLMVSN